MKRLLLLIFVLAALASPAWGGGLLIGSGTRASDCSTVAEGRTVGSFDFYVEGTNRNGFALSWVASTNYQLCSIDLTVKRASTVTGYVSVYIYTGVSGPDTLVATSSTTLNSTNVTTSYSTVKCIFNNVSIINTTRYYIVFMSTEAVASFKYSILSSNSTGTDSAYAYNGSWSLVDATTELQFTAYQ